MINLSPEKWDDTLEDELTELRNGEQVFMTIRPKLIGAGYTTLDSIPRIQKGRGTRFYCPALKGVDSKDLTCRRGSVGQSEGLSIPRSSVRFRLKPDNSNSHEFELHRPSNKGTKLLLKVIKAIIITIAAITLGSLAFTSALLSASLAR